MSPRVRAAGVVAWVVILALACARCGATEDTLRPRLRCSLHTGACVSERVLHTDGGSP